MSRPATSSGSWAATVRQDDAAAAADRRRRARLRSGHPHRRRPRSAICTRPTTSRPEATVRDVIVAGEADHVWAADAWTRAVVEHLLGRGRPGRHGRRAERRRAAADGAGRADARRPRPAGAGRADQPPRRRGRGLAGRAPAHAAGPRHGDAGGQPRPVVPGRRLHPGLGGPRRRRSTRTTAATPRTCWPGPSGPARRPGWPPGGRTCCARSWPGCAAAPPARTSKPKFRIDAATALIADEPPPRDRLELQRFAAPGWARTSST